MKTWARCALLVLLAAGCWLLAAGLHGEPQAGFTVFETADAGAVPITPISKQYPHSREWRVERRGEQRFRLCAARDDFLYATPAAVPEPEVRPIILPGLGVVGWRSRRRV